MSHDGQDAKLIYMVNQIAKFFNSYSDDQAIGEIRNHVIRFWDPRMRAKMAALVERGQTGLSPRAQVAMEQMVALPSQPA